MHVRKNHVGKKQFHGVSVYAFKTEIEIQFFFQALSLKKKTFIFENEEFDTLHSNEDVYWTGHNRCNNGRNGWWFFFAQTKKNWKEKIMRWKNVEKVEKNTMEQNDMDWSDNIDSFH